MQRASRAQRGEHTRARQLIQFSRESRACFFVFSAHAWSLSLAAAAALFAYEIWLSRGEPRRRERDLFKSS